MSVTIPTITLSGQVASMARATIDGTPNTGVTATESKSGQQHVTKLTLSALVVSAIAAAGAEAVGKLLYTFPAGAVLLRAAHLDLELTNTDGDIDADTPDIGLGTTIASGANATLEAVGTGAENVLTGQTTDDCDGTATVKGVTDQALTIQANDDHTVYLNVADTWADDDTGLKATGTVTLEWVDLS